MGREEQHEQEAPGGESSRFGSGSGNVFANLGVPDPQEARVKAGLAQAIAETIGRRGLTQARAAEIMDVDQPKVSAIVRGRLTGTG
ncbi:MAG: helix-turn-helix domain-containing protein [Gemmatimonadetes bacterium]|nr:helix-turn-helix domain-containing protein [Gemmatimonadota bacterium]